MDPSRRRKRLCVGPSPNWSLETGRGKAKSARSPGDERAPELQNGELLLADHGRAEEAQHLIDWIRNRISAAAGEKQTDRARIGCDVFNHQ